MSAAATAWAWGQDPGPTPKLVLLAYADVARDDGAVQIPLRSVALGTGLSDRSVRDNLARLEGDGVLRRYERVEDGAQVASIIVLAVDDSTDLPADFAGGGIPKGFTGRQSGSSAGDSGGPASAAGEGGSSRRPLHLQPTSKSDSGGRRRPRQQMPAPPADTPDGLVADAEELLNRRHKVAATVVSVEEMAIALAALAEFNRQAGYDYGLAAHLTGIVGRIRERPSFGAAEHVRLVESAWRLKWWTKRGGGMRRATPSVIYGNASVFDQVIADATDEKNGRALDAVVKPKQRFVRRPGKGPSTS